MVIWDNLPSNRKRQLALETPNNNPGYTNKLLLTNLYNQYKAKTCFTIDVCLNVYVTESLVLAGHVRKDWGRSFSI